MTKEYKQNLADTDTGLYYNQVEWLEEFLDDKVIFYNDSDSDSETYNNKSSRVGDEQEKICESFNNNNRLKNVSSLLLQELINDLVPGKYCGEELLLCEDIVSSHGFRRMWKFGCKTDS